MSKSIHCPSCGGTLSLDEVTGEALCPICHPSQAVEEIEPGIPATVGPTTKAMMRQIHSSSRRESLVKYSYTLGSALLMCGSAYLCFTWRPLARILTAMGEGGFYVAVFGSIFGSLGLMNLLFLVLRLESPVAFGKFFGPKSDDDFSLPRFPFTIKQLEDSPELLSTVEVPFAKVLMFHTQGHSGGGEGGGSTFYLYDIVVFDADGALYEFKQDFGSEKKMEQLAQKLALLLDVPYERRYTT